jgi:protein TonB
MQTSLVYPANLPKSGENRRFFRLLVSTFAVVLLHFFIIQWLRQPFTEVKPTKPQPIEVTLLPPPVKEKEPEPKPVIKPEPIVKPKPIVKAKPLPPKPEVKPKIEPKIEPKTPPKPQAKAIPKPVAEKPAPVAKPTAPKPTPISPPVLATTRPSPSPALSVQAPTPIAAPGPVSSQAKAPVAAASASAKPAPKPVEDAGGASGDGGNAPPHCHSTPKPEYPRQAKSRHIEGSVKLKVKIGPGGAIEQVTVDTSSGHEMLDNAAIQTVQSSWGCSPAKRNGKAVTGEVRVPINFKLQN